MGTPAAVTPVAPPPGPPPLVPVQTVPKKSWLSKFGHAVGVALGVIAKDAEPVEKIAAAAATAIAPQFAPEIAFADNLATRILDSVKNVEGTFVAVGQGSNGPAKLQAVVNGVSSEMDAWVQANFPGAAAISQASRAGLVNSIVAIANEVDPGLALAAPTPAAVASGAAAVAAVAAAKA